MSERARLFVPMEARLVCDPKDNERVNMDVVGASEWQSSCLLPRAGVAISLESEILSQNHLYGYGPQSPVASPNNISKYDPTESFKVSSWCGILCS